MTPKAKAIKLVDKYWNVKVYTFHVKESIMSKELAVKCALIAVDEILQNFGTLTEGKQHYAAHCTIQFYEQVKQEIKKL